ncbi:MAG: alpha/beta hydrolase-fold protein [Microscillaceae bacterium]|nr:alpha/beta hydrolase-fold protein [Microscillaceae bacterium]
MEILIFGYSGARVLFFPPRIGRFYDYENWGVIEALRHPIEQGWLQVFCVDSVDRESFYCFWCHPRGRITRHLEYENYILYEALPFSRQKNSNPYLMSVGCSFGAYHAVNIALRHPQYFSKVVGMSGRYDLTFSVGVFKDLLDGYYDEDIYFNTPSHYVPNIDNGDYLESIRKLDIILVIGQEDAFLDNNRDLSEKLWNKGIWHALHIWDEEAHKARYWRKMVQLYV